MGLGDIEAFYNKSVHEIFSSKDTYWEQLQRGPGASAARRLQEIIKTDWPNRTPTSCPADSLRSLWEALRAGSWQITLLSCSS